MSSKSSQRLLIVGVSSEEWHDKTGALLEERISREYHEDDFSIVIIHWDKTESSPKVTNFKAFLENYKSVEGTAKCLYCGENAAKLKETISPSDFILGGGEILLPIGAEIVE